MFDAALLSSFFLLSCCFYMLGLIEQGSGFSRSGFFLCLSGFFSAGKLRTTTELSRVMSPREVWFFSTYGQGVTSRPSKDEHIHLSGANIDGYIQYVYPALIIVSVEPLVNSNWDRPTRMCIPQPMDARRAVGVECRKSWLLKQRRMPTSRYSTSRAKPTQLIFTLPTQLIVTLLADPP